jgi:hypothetical protein
VKGLQKSGKHKAQTRQLSEFTGRVVHGSFPDPKQLEPRALRPRAHCDDLANAIDVTLRILNRTLARGRLPRKQACRSRMPIRPAGSCQSLAIILSTTFRAFDPFWLGLNDRNVIAVVVTIARLLIIPRDVSRSQASTSG